MEHEITQESRRTLELTLADFSYFFNEGNRFFYRATENQWSQTGTPWGPAQNYDEAEMDRIVVIDLTQFNGDMNEDAIIAELVNQTASAGAPPQGQTDFSTSATRRAFIGLIRWYIGLEGSNS